MAPRVRPAAATAAALAGAILLAARGGAPAAATIINPVSRQLDVSDLNRAFQLTYSFKIKDFLDGEITKEEGRPDPTDDDDDRCPTALTFSGASEREDGVTTILNTGIVQDGDQCEGPGQFVLIGPDVLSQLNEETGAVGQVVALLGEENADAASLVARMFRYFVDKIANEDVKIGGATEDDRQCGRREVEGRTFIAAANVSETVSVGLGSGLSLEEGRYLITYTLESNPVSALDNPLCIYTGLADGEAPRGSGGGATGPSTDEGVCFPAAATAELDSGATVSMANLEIGDRVRVAAGTGPNAFSEVFTFTHRKRTGTYPFVTATTASGHSLSASPGHYVYVNGHLAPMQSVRVGDALDVAATGTHSRVVAVATAEQTGLFNPQTLAGDIVVGGVRASTYTTAVAPRLAAALLSPLRGLYRLGVTGGWLEAGGEGAIAKAALRLLPLGASA